MEQSLRDKLIEIARDTKKAGRKLGKLSTLEKNIILNSIKNSLLKNSEKVLKANSIDIKNGKDSGMSEGLLDRLFLTEERIKAMIDSIDVVIKLNDPVGNMDQVDKLPNGIQVGKKRVPIGVLAVIYESRPNVTLDAAILAIKSSNAIILRGGKEAINSNKAIVDSIREGIREAGFDENMVNLIENTERESSIELMKLRGYVDLLIPRGSQRLISSVVENSKVPILETGVGNCHLYVDDSADIEKALRIFENGKTQRIGVCNALESLLVSEQISDEFYNGLQDIVDKHGLKVHGCEKSAEKIRNVIEVTDEDYGKEYLDYEFSMKIVSGIDEAIEHIYEYSTHHSEAIVTENLKNATKFIDEVDSACVYINASTRFTDGSEFGLGAEMGISTQRIHARGPVGLKELTTYKYILLGDGQIRG